MSWPVAPVDNVTKLRALAQALPHVTLLERFVPASPESVWEIMGDLEAGVPRFEGNVRAIEILHRDGDRLKLRATSPIGLAMLLDAEMRPGWCVMRSRFGDVGMAVSEAEGGSRIAHFEGSRILTAIARPFLRRNVAGDLERIAALLRR